MKLTNTKEAIGSASRVTFWIGVAVILLALVHLALRVLGRDGRDLAFIVLALWTIFVGTAFGCDVARWWKGRAK